MYVAAGDDIDEAGEWWTLIDIAEEYGALTRAAAVWEISEAASVIQTRPPNIAHFALLLAIVFLLGSLAQRRARQMTRALRLGPASAMLAVGALVVSVGVMVAGALMINERQRQYEATLNPPPERVNFVLPDANSLKRGEALYRERCLVWQGQSADFRALRNRLGRARDDFLYGVVAAGWRDLPACEGALSERDRWDIVNYFRTLEARE